MEEHKKELLEKYLRGACSQEELAQLYDYLRTSPTDEAYREVADRLWEQMPTDRTLAEEKAEVMLKRVFRAKRQSVSTYWYRAAAVLGGLALLISLLYLGTGKDDQAVVYATRYGETKTFLLPDSSRVTLNANSSLTFRFDRSQVREAWLQGEAFFEVRKLKGNPASSGPVKFVVHTDNLDVAVLGTAFNVNDRRGATRVVLAEGKVRIETRHDEQLTMQPGDMVALSSPAATLSTQVVNPDDYTTWRENKLVFKRTPMEEVARLMEDYYGLEVVLDSTDWSDRKITGTIPTGSQEVFLEVLTESMGVRVIRDRDRIVLKKGHAASSSE